PRSIPAIAVAFIATSFTTTKISAAPQAQQNATGPSSSGKRPITEKDLFKFTWIANPQLSPDGSRVAFTRVVVDEKRTGYETSIWTVAATGNEPPLRMTNGKHDTNPRWSPDGRYIAFVRGGEKDETGKPRPAQIAILPLAGGEAWTITDLPKGASNPVWSPDNKTIAFLSTTTPEDIAKEERKKKKPEGESKSKESEAAKNTVEPNRRSRKASTNPTYTLSTARSTATTTKAILIL